LAALDSVNVYSALRHLRILKLQTLAFRSSILVLPHSSSNLRGIEEIHMKRFFLYALMLVLFTAPAFAAKNSQSVSISQAVTVGSTQLPAGEYKVSWTGTGTDVQVTISRSGIAPVTVPAKLVESKHSQNGYMVNRQGGGRSVGNSAVEQS
jgi:hypothetical protein